MEAWNPKQPFINGCFNWMIPNLKKKKLVSFTKHPSILKNGIHFGVNPGAFL